MASTFLLLFHYAFFDLQGLSPHDRTLCSPRAPCTETEDSIDVDIHGKGKRCNISFICFLSEREVIGRAMDVGGMEGHET